jgi:C3HC zinc finger-like
MEKVFRVPHVTAVSPAPPCRPWDRGDLMRRLATFKAMTWFAKPKVCFLVLKIYRALLFILKVKCHKFVIIQTAPFVTHLIAQTTYI